MLGLGLLPLCLVTLLWASALARRTAPHATAAKVARGLTGLAIALAGVALYVAMTAPAAITSAPAASRASELACLVATAVWTLAAAYGAQAIGLLVVAVAWLRTLRHSRSTPA